MAMENGLQLVRDRVTLVLIGAGAGLALWALGGGWQTAAFGTALNVTLFALAAVYAALVLSLTGPIPAERALPGALILALPVTGLVRLAARREVAAGDLLDDPVTLGVVGVLVFFAMPFLSVWLQRRSDLLRYAALFETAWTTTARILVGTGFVALFWLIVGLSDMLLNLVGIDWAGALFDRPALRFAVTGAALGLGLAAVHELRDMISPFVVLRLLRLLVPVVLGVLALFLAAIPLRGVSRMFTELSAAATLMSAAMVAITMISTAVDRDDAQAVSTPGLRLATRLLAILLTPLTGLAVWAVAIRVQQYGWTPDRVLAMAVALFLTGYAVCYAGAVIRGAGWADRIRRVNVAMAVAVIGAAALWMTPALDADRISANSQFARYAAGRADLGQLPLWQLAHRWGRAGQATLDRLAALETGTDAAELAARIAAVRTMPTEFRFNQEILRRGAPDRAATLAALIQVRPGSQTVSPETFLALPGYEVDLLLDGCRRRLPDGRPGCVLVTGGFLPLAGAGRQGIVLYLEPGGDRVAARFLLLREGAEISVREVYDPVADTWPELSADTLIAALDGDFAIVPSGARALRIGSTLLSPAR